MSPTPVNSNSWEIDNGHLHSTWLPRTIDLETIMQEITAHGYYCDCDKTQLEQQLSIVRNKYHLDLSVVYFANGNHISRTLFRDMADYISHNHHGTIIVFNNFSIGTESDVFTRSVLESSESHVKLYLPNTVVTDFARGIVSHHPDWNLIVPVVFSTTIVAILISRISLIARKLRTARHRKSPTASLEIMTAKDAEIIAD